MRRLGAPLVTAVLIGLLAPPAAAGKPAAVFEDAAGDAGNHTQGVAIPGAEDGGFDLVSGSIARVGTDLEFTVTHAAMPSMGALPEGFRFIWAFMVNGKEFRMIAKSFDIGKPDVVAMDGNERIGQVDTDGHFRLEGECERVDAMVTFFVNCPPLEYPEGSFDPATMSFTVVIPMASVGAKPGSKITGSTGEGAAICDAAGGYHACWTTHLAERSSTATIIDAATQTGKYKVPKK
jgi:hypothetical protein